MQQSRISSLPIIYIQEPKTDPDNYPVRGPIIDTCNLPNIQIECLSAMNCSVDFLSVICRYQKDC